MSGPLVVAAVEAELGAVPGVAVGVGPVRAAAGMARLLAERTPEAVLLIGSCGVYGDHFPIGVAVAGSRLSFADTGAVLGKGYVPLPPEPLQSDCARLPPHLPQAVVCTVAAITSDPEAAALHGQDAHCEHMEAYSVALACADAKVPCAVVLGVANRVGPSAHTEWLAHRGAAEAAAQAVALKWLASHGQIPSRMVEPAR